ncbi:hypothetical protein ACFLWW_00180 [Chloroflexota bacterium]
MKNRFRLNLIVAFVLVLAISSGGYAFTYGTASETIDIGEPTGDIATSNTTETQPDWEAVLTPVNDAIIYRPNAIGDEAIVTEQYPVTGEHWDKVDEESSDGDGTYVGTLNNNWEEDLYNIPDHSTQTAAGTINYIKVYMIGRVTAPSTQDSAYIHIKTNGVEYNGNSENLTVSYVAYSHQWNYNPNTESAWTWGEIDDLQIGVGLRRPDVAEYARCTQVYAEVNFDAPLLTASVPTGDLFTVTPNADYTGDFSVKVYLVNTGNLTGAYQSLAMNIYLEGSVEAGQTPNYRTLTLENGVAAFWLDSAGGDDRTLSVNGGTYTLTSREPSEWDADCAVIPEFYCEVTQR